jgi:serine protease Do
MNNNKDKKLLLILGVFAIGFLIGFFITLSTQKVFAGILNDVYNWFSKNLKNISNTTTSTNRDASSGTNESDLKYKPVFDYERAIINAVKKASPAVVSIIITKDLPIIEQCPQVFNPFFDLPPEFKQFFGDDDFGFRFYVPCQKGTKKKEVGGGSGFIVSTDGYVVTNKHVVYDKNADYTVLLNDGTKYAAKVVALDPIQDLAIIKINANSLPVINLGNSDELELGQTVIAIGNALGEFRNTVSVGVVSGLSRTITASGAGYGSETIRGVIQTDAAINPGNSGGPLINLKGEVVGINTAIVSGAQNIGFAIPINQVKRAIQSVKETGSIKTPYLGVRYILITPEIAKKQNLKSDYGALLRGSEDGPAVEPNSPAAKAGLMAEDIILEVNGKKVTQENPLVYLIQKYSVGEKIKLKVLRNGEEIEVFVTLEERPRN